MQIHKPTVSHGMRQARLWMALAVAATLLNHAATGLQWTTALGLANCALFAWVQWQYLKPQPNAAFLMGSQRHWFRYIASVAAMLTLAGVAIQFQTLLGKEAGIAGLTVLSAFKLWEYHTARDTHVMTGLLFFLLLSVFLKQESLLTFLGVLAATTLVIAAWLMVYHSPDVADTALGNHLHPQNKLSNPIKPLREVAGLAILGLPLALFLFFVFPRVAGPLWGLPSDAHSSKIGLSNTLEPGRFSKLAKSDELAFTAKFAGTVPPGQQLYWRGPVLSQFDGLVWRASPLFEKQALRLNAANVATAKRYDYQLIAEPHGQSFRVLLDVPIQAQGMSLTAQASPYAAPLLERESTIATSLLGLNWRISQDPNATAAQQRDALQEDINLPANSNPRTLQYASQLRQTLGINEQDPSVFIQAVLQNYREKFTYSLEPKTPQGRVQDAIDGFLFDTREGYCEHFAASFVVLMRALDFPARIVTGYQGGERNPKDNWITVNQNDAHAWAEVLHPTRGWLRVDPTAAVAPWRIELGGGALSTNAGAPNGAAQNLLKQSKTLLKPLAQWAQASLRAWQDYGLNYGKERQKNLFKRIGFDEVNVQSIAALFSAGVGLWILLMLFAYRQKRVKPSAHALLLKEFDRFCAKQKHPRLPHETPHLWVAHHESYLDKDQLAWATRFIQRYERSLFSKPSA